MSQGGGGVQYGALCLTWWSLADIGKNFGHDQEYLCGCAKEFFQEC